MRKILIISVVLMTFSITGCDFLNDLAMSKRKKRQVAVQQEPVIDMVEDTQLAKLILTPKKYKLNITRDPFEPIISTKEDEVVVKKIETVEDMLKDIKFLGVVKVNDAYSALLETSVKKGVFNINDEVNKLIIVDIQEEQVVFKKGTETHILKRGDK